jgi:hypothetical protein
MRNAIRRSGCRCQNRAAKSAPRRGTSRSARRMVVKGVLPAFKIWAAAALLDLVQESFVDASAQKPIVKRFNVMSKILSDQGIVCRADKVEDGGAGRCKKGHQFKIWAAAALLDLVQESFVDASAQKPIDERKVIRLALMSLFASAGTTIFNFSYMSAPTNGSESVGISSESCAAM